MLADVVFFPADPSITEARMRGIVPIAIPP
jgi:hypothetical protein